MFEAVGRGRETMAGCGWLWVVLVKLWLVVDRRDSWWQNFGLPVSGCGWLWVVQAKLWLVLVGRG